MFMQSHSYAVVLSLQKQTNINQYILFVRILILKLMESYWNKDPFFHADFISQHTQSQTTNKQEVLTHIRKWGTLK